MLYAHIPHITSLLDDIFFSIAGSKVYASVFTTHFVATYTQPTLRIDADKLFNYIHFMYMK